jgi:hypothetical protein
MAIVQISKIQHRRGLKENLPNLGSAELGWALDTRQLYIGNGTLTEGAPTLGRTEILTEYSDLLGVIGSYTYSGESASGFIAETGPSLASPISRSLQARLDDVVSVKAFGAKGDGTTDDTVAINRALYQLYCAEQVPQVRKTLLFPAGTYIISEPIKIPTYATIVGEGKGSTIIKQTVDDWAFKFADSLQQIGAAIGDNSAIRPSYISISEITFDQDADGSIGLISAAESCLFHNVKFTNNLLDPSDAGTSKTAISIESTPVLNTRNIRFLGCEFIKITYAVVIDDDCQNLTWDGCYFYQLYRAFKLGENVSGSGSSIYGPQGVRIVNSYFNNIANVAIYGYADVTGIHSGFNIFNEVGNAYAGAGNPISPVIIFSGDHNFSIGDRFERNDADDAVYPRVSHDAYSVYVQYADETHFGTLHQKNGGQVTLADGELTPVATGITFTTAATPMLILDYSLVRNGFYRAGRMLIAHSSSAQNIDDTFIETTDIGVTFSLSYSAGTTSLDYTTTSIGFTGTLAYAIRYLK